MSIPAKELPMCDVNVETLARNIDFHLEQKQWTQRMLAGSMLGVKRQGRFLFRPEQINSLQSAISSYRNRRRPTISIDHRFALAQIFGVAEDVLTGTLPPAKSTARIDLSVLPSTSKAKRIFALAGQLGLPISFWSMTYSAEVTLQAIKIAEAKRGRCGSTTVRFRTPSNGYVNLNVEELMNRYNPATLNFQINCF
jgi:hypothetical protein